MGAPILKYILYSFFLPFWWLQRVIPRNKNVWVFGAWDGRRFSDNSRYLYTFVKENHSEITAVWITRDVSIKRDIRRMGGLAYLRYDLKGIYYSLIAAKIFISNGKKDVSYLFINGAKWIQLWHGSPMKKIGLDDRFASFHSFFQKKILANFFPFLYAFNNDYILSNSEIFTKIMASSFNMPINRVLETGFPRNDVFYQKEQDPFNVRLRNRFVDCKLIYYLPTFRGSAKAKSLFTLEDFERDELELFLEKNNLVFVSKGHFIDNLLFEKEVNNNSRFIDLADDEVSDINFMLKDADLLITDYSSAYFDFLLTERPMIFAAFDLVEYLSDSREMYFDYENLVSGPITKNWTELYASLESIWQDEYYRQLTKDKNVNYNKWHDGKNCERVFEAIISREK